MLLLGVSAALMGCVPRNAVAPIAPATVPVLEHAVFMDYDGNGVEPSTSSRARVLTDTAYLRYVDRIMAHMAADTHSVTVDSASGRSTRRVLIYLQGGMNHLQAGMRTSARLLDAIRSDSGDAGRTYPIFINWNSSLVSTLQERLGAVRIRGRTVPVASQAFVLSSDLLAGVARYPFVWTRAAFDGPARFANDLRALDSATIGRSPRERAFLASSVAIDSRDHPAAIAVSRAAFHRTKREWLLHHVPSLVFAVVPTRCFVNCRWRDARAGVVTWLPPKAFTTLLLSGLGKPAWEMMHRRTNLAFQRDERRLRRSDVVAAPHPNDGAVGVLLARLGEQVQRDTLAYELTVIGHSMGTIMANEMVRRRPDLPWRHIVFLAGAASMREFSVGVLPYLQRAVDAGRPADFYNLTLHPYADLRGWVGPQALKPASALLPYGSLLEYVDRYFVNDETRLEYTTGKYRNFAESAYIIEAGPVRGRVHLKAFGYRSGTGCDAARDLPYEHAHFQDPRVPFWRPAFWHPARGTCAEGDRRAPPSAPAAPPR
ncbi:MAG TPA: hypothetical protein VFV33_07225 [Gemmatimonadaceae bacterium]|nr:hypothetical protein [Gemmatimonadaceae bacterium]